MAEKVAAKLPGLRKPQSYETKSVLWRWGLPVGRAFLTLWMVLVATVSGLAEKRVALVLADDTYRTLRPLGNAVNDGRAMEEALARLGFEVTSESNRDLRRMRRALEDFSVDAAGADVALVFFAGHGVEIAGENRLLPIDADASSLARLEATSLPLEDIARQIASLGKVGLIVLDACRSDPFGHNVAGTAQGRGAVPLAAEIANSVQPGLGRVGKAENVLFAFSAAPGETALDGADGNSPFSAALAKYIGTEGLEIRSVMTLVQQEVYDLTRGKQLPYVESGLPRLFFASTQAGDLPERERLLLAMADVTPDLRAEVEHTAAERDMPLAPLYAALISSDSAGLDEGARSRKLAEAADAFVAVREELKTMAASDPAVERLRDAAETAISLGAFDTARQSLAEAAEIDGVSRRALKTNFAERTLSEAATRGLSGGAALASLRYDQAIADYEKAIALYEEAGDAAFAPTAADQRLRVLEALGELYITVGDVSAAGRSFAMLTEAVERRLRDDPDPGIRRDLATAHRKHGNTEMTLGRLDAALADYNQARDILQDLVDKVPPRRTWLGDLARTNDQIAIVLTAAGDTSGAVQAMEQSLSLKRELADADPDNADLQRDITVSYDVIGDALHQAGDEDSAEIAFQASLDIRIALAAAQPDDAERQRDLSVSRDKMGDVMRAKGDNQGALQSYMAGLDIVLALAARDKSDTGLQRDLSVTEAKIGNVLRDGGDLDGAKDHFDRSLAIIEKLAEHDPENSTWQRDMSVSIEKVADVEKLKGDKGAALAGYERSLAIMRRLSKSDASNAEWRHDLSITLDQVGNLRIAVRDYAGAHDVLAESLAIRKQLAAAQPNNGSLQVDLLIGFLDYAQVAPDPKTVLAAGIAVGDQLERDGRLTRNAALITGMLRKNLLRLQKRKT